MFMTKHILSLSLEGINLMSEMYTAQEITKILPTETKEKKKKKQAQASEEEERLFKTQTCYRSFLTQKSGPQTP